MSKKTQLCYCCKKNRLADNVKLQRMGKKAYWICNECNKELKLTKMIMKLTVDGWMKKYPKKYERTSAISVKCLE